MNWGGRANDPDHDRCWWTKIHGGDYDQWSRKFPLPGEFDDRAMCYEFRFSDGQSLLVPNTTRMAMNSNGPKYRPQDGNREPCKDHPKIGAIPNTSPTWVEYRLCR